jgi:hypothetical protein
MDEHAIDVGDLQRRSPLVMECRSRRFPVVTMSRDDCLIEAPEGVVPGGFVDIFDGDRHVEQCLVVLAAPEGPFLRCTFKRRTPSRLDPPRDFAG